MKTATEIVVPSGTAQIGCLTVDVVRTAVTNNRQRVIGLSDRWSVHITVRSKSYSETNYTGTDFNFYSDTSYASTVWGEDDRQPNTMRAELAFEYAELADIFRNMPTLAELESAIESAFDAMQSMQAGA